MGRRALLGTGALVLLAAGLAAGLSGRAGSPRPAPSLPTQTLVGPRPSTAALRGSPALVVFWASWCGPCHREAPAVERFATEPGSGARVVGVDFNDAGDSARAFIARYHWTFPNLRDANGTLGGSWGLLGLPTTVLVDARGRIAARLTGEQSVASLTRAVRSLAPGAQGSSSASGP